MNVDGVLTGLLNGLNYFRSSNIEAYVLRELSANGSVEEGVLERNNADLGRHRITCSDLNILCCKY